MELTDKQLEGLVLALKRYASNEPYTCIAGYAGTGKSTLIKFIVAALNLSQDDVAYITFTGKAAEVLRHKGCPNACTAHKLLYYSTRLKNGKFVFRPRPRGDIQYKLIIVDEISMLPKELWDLLLSHKVPVIACGDPFQIPPIRSETDNHVLDNPHIFLDEVMRQAQDSEIIKFSMDVREGKNLPYFKGKEVQILDEEEIGVAHYKWADQILCATNKTRQMINNTVRKSYGRGQEPEVGDKLICLSNYWDIVDSSGEAALVNGTLGYIENFEYDIIEYHIPSYRNRLDKKVKVIRIRLKTMTDEIFEDLTVDYNYLVNGKKSLTPEEEYTIRKYNKLAENPVELPLEFNWGYAITTHKAQGSQWSKVLVIEENFPFDKTEHARWVYTAMTRPEQKLVLAR